MNSKIRFTLLTACSCSLLTILSLTTLCANQSCPNERLYSILPVMIVLSSMFSGIAYLQGARVQRSFDALVCELAQLRNVGKILEDIIVEDAEMGREESSYFTDSEESMDGGRQKENMAAPKLVEDGHDPCSTDDLVEEAAPALTTIAAVNKVVREIVLFLPISLFSETRNPVGIANISSPVTNGENKDLSPMDDDGASSTGLSNNESERHHELYSATSWMSKSSALSRELRLTASVQGELCLTNRRVTMLVANVRSFKKSMGDDMIVDDIVYLLGDVSSTLFNVVGSFRGILDSFHGDHFVFSFNAFSNVTTHTKKAAKAALQASEDISELSSGRIQLSCGISSGNALVGNVGNGVLRRPSVLGNVYAQATVLQRLTKFYFPTSERGSLGKSTKVLHHEHGHHHHMFGAGTGVHHQDEYSLFPPLQCLISKVVYMDVQYEAKCQILDIISLPGMIKPTIVAAIHGELDEHPDVPQRKAMMVEEVQSPMGSVIEVEKLRHHTTEEWMYAREERYNPFALVNEGFTELLSGHAGAANDFLLRHLEKAERQKKEAAAVGAEPGSPTNQLKVAIIPRGPLATLGSDNLVNAIRRCLDTEKPSASTSTTSDHRGITTGGTPIFTVVGSPHTGLDVIPRDFGPYFSHCVLSK